MQTKIWDCLALAMIHSNSFQLHCFFIFLLLSPTLHPWPPSNPRLIHSTIQFPELSSSLKLNYGSIFTFLKPRHWWMCFVEWCAVLFGPHVSPSRGDNLCHSLRPLFKSRSSNRLFCFVCFRRFTQINWVGLLFGDKYFLLLDLMFDYRPFGGSSQRCIERTLQGWLRSGHFIFSDNTELYTVFS